MQIVSAGYRQAVQQGEQYPVTRVRVDWDNDGSAVDVEVGSVTVERTITTDLPAEVTLISGVAAATATVQLVGSPTDPAKSVARLYSPYRTDSPLYGVDVERAPATVEMGLRVAGDSEYLSQLVGRVRDLSVTASGDGADATVQLVDGSQDFRFAPTLPVVVAADVTSGLQPGLDAAWFVSQIARQAGYDPVPPIITTVPFATVTVLLSATMHGSATPDPACGATLTSAATSQGGPLQFGSGAFVAGTSPDTVDGGLGSAVYSNIQPYAGAFTGFGYLLLEMWCQPTAVSYPTGDLIVDQASLPADYIRLCNNGTNYVLRFRGGADSVGPAVTSSTSWHYVAAYLHFSSFLEITWNIDGVVTTGSGFGTTPLFAPGSTAITVQTYNAMEAVQVVRVTDTGGGGAPAPWSYPFTPTAMVDFPLAGLTATPAIDSTTDAQSIIQDIARAAGGVALIDERGVFQFWGRRHFGTAAASITTQRTVRASVPVTSVTVQRLADRIRNIVRVPVTPYRVTGLAIVWQLSDVVEIKANSTEVRTVSVAPAQAYQIDTFTFSPIPSGGPLVNGHSALRAARNADGTGGEILNLTMTVTPTAGSIDITVRNPNTFSAWLVSPSGAGYPAGSNGQPSMALVGRLITDEGVDPDTGASTGASAVTVEYRDENSITAYGERPVTLDSSVWRQSSGDAADLAGEVGYRISRPRPQWPPISIVADPSLMIGDRVWVTDDSGVLGLDDPGIVTGYTLRDTTDGPSMDLQIQPIAPPAGLILDDPVRGTLDGRWKI